MTFLPIVERELRVAARRKSTFVIRCAAALAALALVGILMLYTLFNPHLGGKYIFTAVSSYVFLMAMLGGVFLAADCLSRERREGSLGFLFLTDLKGYDVVLGKFMGIALNAFYGLLAVLPVLGLSLLSGGVTGEEFSRMSLALVNALFFSTAASIWISSRSVTSQRALVAAICLLFGVFVLAILIQVAARHVPIGWAPPLTCLGAISPGESFLLASNAGYLYGAQKFWWSLAISNLVGWLFLGLAAWQLPGFIQPTGETVFWERLWMGEFLFGKFRRRPALLETNPVLWLIDDSRRLGWVVWTLTVVGGALMIALCRSAMGVIFNVYVSWPFYFLLKVLFTIQACRFFSEARRSGSWELICVTPLTGPAMLRGQWLALRQIFLWPVIILMASQAAAMLFANHSFPGANFMILYGPFQVLWQMGRSVADFFAAGWVGMWLALTGKKPEMAAGLTVLFVLILPIFAFCVPTMAIDVVFIVLARSKVLGYFPKPSLILGGRAGH